MTYRRFSSEGLLIVLAADRVARRLGHRWVGTEHLLYAVADSRGPTGDKLREAGLRPGTIEGQMRSAADPTSGGDVPGRFELQSIGIDVEAVTAAAEAAHGLGALAHSAVVARAQSGLRRGSSVPRSLRNMDTVLLTRRASTMIRQAQRLARGQQRPVEASHLAHALTTDTEGPVGRIMVELGTDPLIIADITREDHTRPGPGQ